MSIESINSIKVLRKLINNHHDKLNSILVKLNTDRIRVKTSTRKISSTEAELKKFPFDKIIQNIFDINTDSSNMEKEDFYKKYITVLGNKDIVFYLTNGANKALVSGGAGTNRAITNINTNFFNNLNKDNCIFPSEKYVQNTILNEEAQNITKTNMLNNCKHPGSTYYVDIPNFKYKSKYNIRGVYHINGWNHKISNVEDEKDYKRLVTAYYIAIMDHFFKFILKDKISILHLVQCPGEIFGGKEITAKIFKNTVYGYLFDNREKLKDLQFRISIDYETNEKFNYEDYKSYNDLKK